MDGDLRDRVTQVHVRVLISCQSQTKVQEKELRLIDGTAQNRGSLGDIEPGRYAVEAVGYEVQGDQICAIARGCISQSFSAGGDDTILVELDTLDTPTCMPLGDGGVVDAGMEDGFVEPRRDSGICRADNETCNGEDDDCDSRIDETTGGVDNRASCGLCRVVCEDDETCARGACVPAMVEVAPGAEHTCAARSDGQVYCWGANVVGQLGTGNNAESLSPARASGIVDATHVGVGRFHSCVLRTTGQVACWGDSTWGQVGIAGGFRNAPTLIGGVGSDARGIGVGFFHNCIVNNTGGVMCWGWASQGQLGRPYNETGDVQAAVRSVPNVEDVVEVESGFSFTCARHENRTVSCWGSNAFGQLGDGTLASRHTPALVEDESGDPLDDIIALGLGGEHACVVREGATNGQGPMLCWGTNDYGSIGNGSMGSAVVNPTPSNITDAVDLAVGYLMSCARRPTDKMLCWGTNEAGQLGNGTQTSSPYPVEVRSLDTSALFVDSGDYHACAIGQDMSVYCWGANNLGQLGFGTKTSTPQLTPARVGGI